MKENSILLFSGGIDSFIAYHWLGKPKTLYFDVNSRYTQRELKVVKELIPTTIIDTSLDFSTREIGINAYIPFRNLLLAAQAAKYASTIYIIGIKDDNVSDKSPEAFKRMSEMLTYLENKEIKIVSPFWNATKVEIIQWYLRMDLSKETLLKTISCYSPDEETNYCGKCPSCFRKWVAFRLNGINIDFENMGLLQEYYAKAKQGFYDIDRNGNIINAIDDYCN